MPSFNATLPAIDQNLNGAWTEQDQNLYAKLPYYFERMDADMRGRYSVWEKLLTDRIAWTPNMATIMRAVMVEKSPVLRQEARPNTIQTNPLRDIFNVRERTVDAVLYWHQFVSPHFRFLPAFQDFMKGNLVPTRKNIEEQIRIYSDMFYRTYIWDYSPYIYVAGYGLVSAPVGRNADGTSKKTAAWLQTEVMQKIPADGYVTFRELFKFLNAAEEEVGMTPYEGTGLPGGDSAPLNERFCFVCSSQTWNNFVDDPWLKENRPLNMNIVTDSFKGDFFGKIRCKLEKYPLRFALSADKVPSLPAPETIDLEATSAEYNRTRPKDGYAKTASAPVEVDWLVGGKAYKIIDSGPPPEFFAGATSDPQKLAGMQWNGQVYGNKNFLVPYTDASGNIVMDTNSFGHYMRFQSEKTFGIINPNAQNIIPIVSLRRAPNVNTVLI